MTAARKTVTDRRVQKTRALLREALISLSREKSYDSVSVREILDRANVGRSTFYTHFRDKDDLLVSGIHDMLLAVQSTGSPSLAKGYEKILWFSLPIFEYHEQHRHAGKDRMGSRGRAILHGHLQRVLAELIADDLKNDAGQRKRANQIPPDLLVQYVASTFTLVLNWWLDRRSPLPPEEINNLFRALVLPALTTIQR